MFTLRYIKGSPAQPRPHGPTVPTFTTRTEAVLHLEDQPNREVLEVVER